MPIGGLREKCNAASREHIKTVFIPFENHKDMLELPKEISSALNIVEVKKVPDLFKGVFLDDITKMKKDIEKRTTPKKPSKASKKD
jgi:ATP-dependent Lon protease